MIYELNGKKIKIPDSEIEKSMKVLDLSRNEAIEMWLEDEGYLENDEQEELTKKAKDNKITATIHDAQSDSAKKKGRKKGERKPDPDKEFLIEKLNKFLSDIVDNVQVVNVGKLISFAYNGSKYEIDLKRKRERTKK